MTSKSNESWLRRGWQGVANLALGLAGIACLWLGVVALASGSDLTAAATGLTSGLVLLLASSIDRFEVLKGLGMEARTRQELNQKITEATAKLAQLRELAELSCDVVVSMTSKVGRWDSASTVEEAYETVQRVRRHLTNLQSSDETIRKTLAPWVAMTSADLVRKLVGDISKKIALGTEHYDLQLRNYPLPLVAGDQKYQSILDFRQRFINFQVQHLGDVHNWPIGTHAAKLRDIVEFAPLLNEADRLELRALVSPWVPRLAYLAVKCDLNDKEAWFAFLNELQDTVSRLFQQHNA